MSSNLIPVEPAMIVLLFVAFHAAEYRTALAEGNLAGGSGGREFGHELRDGSFLIGLKLTQVKFNNVDKVISSVQPVYRSKEGNVIEGPTFGRVAGAVRRLGCDPTLRVQAVIVRSGIYVDAIKLRLIPIDTESRTRDTEWVGGSGGGEHVLGQDSHPIIGIRGRCALIIDAIGVVAVTGPPGKVAAGDQDIVTMDSVSFQGNANALLQRANGFVLAGQLRSLTSQRVIFRMPNKITPLELRASDVKVIQTKDWFYAYNHGERRFDRTPVRSQQTTGSTARSSGDLVERLFTRIAEGYEESGKLADEIRTKNRERTGHDFAVGDYVKNATFLVLWTGRVVAVEGTRFKVRIDYSSGAYGSGKYAEGNTYDFLETELAISVNPSVASVIDKFKP